ncbi:hypothetical protein ONZ45_g16029 [Pleurotus djamor]|nr:hypothetical protein ONZ45_g16029 [Pleurotus djamor]
MRSTGGGLAPPRRSGVASSTLVALVGAFRSQGATAATASRFSSVHRTVDVKSKLCKYASNGGWIGESDNESDNDRDESSPLDGPAVISHSGQPVPIPSPLVTGAITRSPGVSLPPGNSLPGSVKQEWNGDSGEEQADDEDMQDASNGGWIGGSDNESDNDRDESSPLDGPAVIPHSGQPIPIIAPRVTGLSARPSQVVSAQQRASIKEEWNGDSGEEQADDEDMQDASNGGWIGESSNERDDDRDESTLLDGSAVISHSGQPVPIPSPLTTGLSARSSRAFSPQQHALIRQVRNGDSGPDGTHNVHIADHTPFCHPSLKLASHPSWNGASDAEVAAGTPYDNDPPNISVPSLHGTPAFGACRPPPSALPSQFHVTLPTFPPTTASTGAIPSLLPLPHSNALSTGIAIDFPKSPVTHHISDANRPCSIDEGSDSHELGIKRRDPPPDFVPRSAPNPNKESLATGFPTNLPDTTFADTASDWKGESDGAHRFEHVLFESTVDSANAEGDIDNPEGPPLYATEEKGSSNAFGLSSYHSMHDPDTEVWDGQSEGSQQFGVERIDGMDDVSPTKAPPREYPDLLISTVPLNRNAVPPHSSNPFPIPSTSIQTTSSVRASPPDDLPLGMSTGALFLPDDDGNVAPGLDDGQHGRSENDASSEWDGRSENDADNEWDGRSENDANEWDGLHENDAATEWDGKSVSLERGSLRGKSDNGNVLMPDYFASDDEWNGRSDNDVQVPWGGVSSLAEDNTRDGPPRLGIDAQPDWFPGDRDLWLPRPKSPPRPPSLGMNQDPYEQRNDPPDPGPSIKLPRGDVRHLNPVLLQLKKDVRKYCDQTLMKGEIRVPSPAALRSYNLRELRHPRPTLEDFSLDLAQPTLHTSWNAEAIQVFVAGFCGTTVHSDYTLIEHVFKRHMIHLCNRYRHRPRYSVSKDKARENRRRRLAGMKPTIRHNLSVIELLSLIGALKKTM